jgi:hypothetical protein
MDYGQDGPGSILGSTKLLSTVSRPILGPSQSSVQWVTGTLSSGVKRQRRETDHSPHLVPRSRKMELYLHSPMCLHGIVLNSLSTGATLPFPNHVLSTAVVICEARGNVVG